MPCAKYSYNQIKQIWVQGGGNPKLADIMAAIALAESGGNSCALNNTPSTGDYSVGLWQINYFGSMLRSRSAKYGAPQVLQQNPIAQARAAKDLAKFDGSGLGNWTTYTSGAYKSHLGGRKGGRSIGSKIIGGVEAIATGGAYGNVSDIPLPSLPNPLGGVEGAIGSAAMKFLYGIAVFGGLLLLLLGLLLVGADIGLEKLEPKPVRKTRTTLAKAGIRNRVDKGNQKGFEEGFDTGQSVAEEKARTKAEKKEAKRQERYSQSEEVPF